MTVCVASFAENSKCIVMVSDKAVTYGSTSPMPIESDTEATKFLRVGDTFWYAMIAGDPTFAMKVVDKVGEKTTANPDIQKRILQMMDCFKESYKECRESFVDDQVLGPRLLTKQLLVARPNTLLPLDQESFQDILEEVRQFRTNSSLLVCGFDDRKQAHLFSVSNPGKVENHDLTGFYAVGIGARTAIARLLLLESSKKDKLPQALYQSFDAKVNAELNPGVGYYWDAEILVAGRKATSISKETVTLVENVYRSFPDTPFRKKKYKEPRNWRKRLDELRDRIMSSG